VGAFERALGGWLRQTGVATTCCPSRPTNPRSGPPSRGRFPLWTAGGPDGTGPPGRPPWYEAELRRKGGGYSAVAGREPKARHGRREVRLLWALADPLVNRFAGSLGTAATAWPHLRQVCRVERRRAVRRRGRTMEEVEVGYAITSLAPARADARALLGYLRGHWGIENRLHWVRDVVFDEDRSQARTGAAAQVMAAGRNLALALLRRAGHACIAAALRTYAGRPRHAAALVLGAAAV
jgi:hypothetical protein